LIYRLIIAVTALAVLPYNIEQEYSRAMFPSLPAPHFTSRGSLWRIGSGTLPFIAVLL